MADDEMLVALSDEVFSVVAEGVFVLVESILIGVFFS